MNAIMSVMSTMMKNPRVIATIEARMNANRLPGKVMLSILGKPMLERMIERVKRAKLVDQIVVATTKNRDDDAIATLAKKLKTGWFRGSEDDVLGRVLGAAEKYHGSIIVELTVDCPLIDPRQIDDGVKLFLSGNYDYVANDNIVQTVPRGFDVQVFSVKKLKEVDEITDDRRVHEHVSLYFYEHPKTFRLKSFGPPIAERRTDIRLTVDTEKDLELVRRIFRLLYPKKPNFDYKDVIDLLTKHPLMLEINRDIDQKIARYTEEDDQRIRTSMIRGDFSYRPKWKAAIIGCGRIASEFDNDPKRLDVSSHAGAYQTHPDIQLLAACDVDPGKRRAFQKRWGEVQVYKNARELFKQEHVDIVSVTTKNDQQYRIMRDAIDAGVKAIFCEKPFTDRVARARDIVECCRQREIVLLVDYNRRFDPMHRRLSSLMKKERFGRFLGGVVYYSNGFINAGSHAVDLVTFFCGDVTHVRTVGSGGRLEDPDLDVIFTLAGGGRMFVKSIDADSYYQFELDALFERGRVRILRQGTVAEVFHVVDHPEASGVRQLSSHPLQFTDGRYATLPDAISHLVNILRGKSTPWSTGENASRVLEILAAATWSSKSGKETKLPFVASVVLSSNVRSK